jgi:hypothetical protein
METVMKLTLEGKHPAVIAAVIIENWGAERSLDFLAIMGKQHLRRGDNRLKAPERAVLLLHILAEFSDHGWVAINDRGLITPNDVISGFCHLPAHG